MAAKPQKDINLSTEEKFKESARIVFMKKGYAATKTRDIAEHAGLNLALLNYYFRSKEKLFEIIMLEKVHQLFNFIAPALNNRTTSLEEKIHWIAENYMDFFLTNPELPLFVLSEISRNPERFAKNIQLGNYILKSHFIEQIAAVKKEVNPFQFFITFLGMIIFPFIVKPVFKATGILNEQLFAQLMEDRKALAAKWMKMMLE
ncbi:TetR/AcrR family transcriptional regulator [Pedobacter sp. Du54]|uniref:TetR/AcrR family transcriptional regulator n=1 Tax=Pedobacter anseongensis TaxID=3133439 RepID=UPI003097F39C